MLRCSALFALALLVTAPAAGAAGFNLTWDACAGGGGVRAKTFACDDNGASAHTLYLSATAPPGITQWTGFRWEISVASTIEDLPDWWYLRGSGMCRNGALAASATSTSAGCTDAYQGNALGGITSYNVGSGSTSILVGGLAGGWTVPEAASLIEGEEYFVTRLVLSNQKTTGPEACAGCVVGSCLFVQSVTILQAPGTAGGDVNLDSPDASFVAGWQGEFIVNDCGLCQSVNKPSFTTCTICPVQNSTWSRVKAIYR